MRRQAVRRIWVVDWNRRNAFRLYVVAVKGWLR